MQLQENLPLGMKDDSEKGEAGTCHTISHEYPCADIDESYVLGRYRSGSVVRHLHSWKHEGALDAWFFPIRKKIHGMSDHQQMGMQTKR